MSSSNPLIQAPHVPKRAPEWNQFLEPAAGPTRPENAGTNITQRPQAGSWRQGGPSHGASHQLGKPAWQAHQHPHSQGQHQQEQPQHQKPATALQHAPIRSQPCSLPVLDDSRAAGSVWGAKDQRASFSAARPTEQLQPQLQQAVHTRCAGQQLHASRIGNEHLHQAQPQSWQLSTSQLEQHGWPAQQKQQQQQQQQKEQLRGPHVGLQKLAAAIEGNDGSDVSLPDFLLSPWDQQAHSTGASKAHPAAGAAAESTGPPAYEQPCSTSLLRSEPVVQQATGHEQQQWQQQGPQYLHCFMQKQQGYADCYLPQGLPQRPQHLEHQQRQQQQQAALTQQLAKQHEPWDDCHDQFLQQAQPALVQPPTLQSAFERLDVLQHPHGQQNRLHMDQRLQSQQRQLSQQQQLLRQHQQQQQHQQPPRRQQQQEQQQQQWQAGHTPAGRGAAASKWATGSSRLASLTRVPGMMSVHAAADKADGAATAGDAGQASSSKRAAGAKKGAGAKPVRGAKGGGKGQGGSAPKHSQPGSSVTMELTAIESGAALPKVFHQATLFDTLKRAERNRQGEQHRLQESGQQQQQEADGSPDQPPATNVAAATAAKQLAGRKRKSSTAAAAAAGEPDGADGEANSAVNKPGSNGPRKRRVSKAGKASMAEVEGGIETLDTWQLSNAGPQQHAVIAGGQTAGGAARKPCMFDITSESSPAWHQLQQELVQAEGLALGLLYSRSVPGSRQSAQLARQYFTSMQQPNKQQQQLLGKASSMAKKQAAASAAAAGCSLLSVEVAAGDGVTTGSTGAGSSAQEAAEASGTDTVIGLALMPVTQGNSPLTTTAAAAAQATPVAAPLPAAAHSSSSARADLHMYFMYLVQAPAAGSAEVGDQQQQLPQHTLQLLHAVLQDPDSRPCICCNAKAVLCSLARLGLALPPASVLNIIDLELLGWMLDPQLIQDTKKEDCYSLEQQLARSGFQGAPDHVGGRHGPLQRLCSQLQQSLQLVGVLYGQLDHGGGIAKEAIKLEMQVSTVLAKMEVAGVACSPSVLSGHRATLASRLEAINARAAQLAGKSFNLSSSSQLAKVLYEDLRLAPPTAGGRGAAKTHLSTNEQALKQLAAQHELPGLVLEHRCIMNVVSKWIDAPWVAQAARQAAARVHCRWQQTSTATGRLSSCTPNLQAVTKYTITAQQQDSLAAAEDAGAAEGYNASSAPVLTINVRDAFVAPAGKLLLSADYSQVELRLLAHFSEDPLLCQILQQQGGDVFNMIAAALRQAGALHGHTALSSAAVGAGGPQVPPEERERAKRVVYGIVYGLTSFGLAQALSDQGISPATAQGLINSFLARFTGVRKFMSQCVSAAQAAGAVHTLMGRWRPIAGLAAADFQERSAAERKVVNSQIQGSAADLVKLAMCGWDNWAAQHLQQQQQQDIASYGRGSSSCTGARLIAQIHDELLFEVDAADATVGPDGKLLHPGSNFLHVAAAVKGIMEGAAPLRVPLRVKLAWGSSWGSLSELDLG